MKSSFLEVISLTGEVFDQKILRNELEFPHALNQRSTYIDSGVD
jgi:hypothetical protein